jgi:predicted nucleic acid-binding protein
MKYVLDSSTAFKWAVAEIHTDKALRLRDDFVRALQELIAPDVFPIELAHSLTRAERQGRVTSSQAAILWRTVMQTSPVLIPSLPMIPRALDLSSQFQQSVYDCLYVALAEHEQCDLITADDKLVKKLGPHFSFIIALSTLP